MGHVEQSGGSAGMQMLLQHAGRVLHRHLVAGERHHLAAARDMQRVKRRTPQRIVAESRSKHRGPSRAPRTIPRQPAIEAPSVAVPESIIPSAAASRQRRGSFQMSANHAVLLPESFRGGCSFGAGDHKGRSLPTRSTQVRTKPRAAPALSTRPRAYIQRAPLASCRKPLIRRVSGQRSNPPLKARRGKFGHARRRAAAAMG